MKEWLFRPNRTIIPTVILLRPPDFRERFIILAALVHLFLIKYFDLSYLKKSYLVLSIFYLRINNRTGQHQFKREGDIRKIFSTPSAFVENQTYMFIMSSNTFFI